MSRIRVIRKVSRGCSGVWILSFLWFSYMGLVDVVVVNTRDIYLVPGVPSESSQQDQLLGTLPSNVLVVEPYHGLGNRLRAYASAAALAKKSGRALAVVWIPDMHLWAKFTDLFQTPEGVKVFEHGILPSVERLQGNILYYDYNSRGGKDKVLRDRSHRAIYVRSAYVLQSETKVSEEDIILELKSLKPTPSVQRRVSQAISGLEGTKEIIGVHIRMQTNIELDVPGISQLPAKHAAGIESMGPLQQKRSLCHYTNFVPKLESVKGENVSFLVASDSPEATHALRGIFGVQILTVRDSRDSCLARSIRSSDCAQAALAEFIVLSRVSSSLILSDWSSASELIRRLSAPTPHTNGCSVGRKSCLRDIFACLKRALLV